MNSAALSCRDALAVLLDDPNGHTATELHQARAHAGTCPRCASALDDPDSAGRVLQTLATRRPSPSNVLRLLLVGLAVAQLVVASPWLFGASLVPDQQVAVAHLTRDGALGLVVAALGLLVAWRPRYALVALLMGSAVLVIQFAAGIIDNQDRNVSTTFELMHLLVFAVLGLIALVTSNGRGSVPGRHHKPQPLRPL